MKRKTRKFEGLPVIDATSDVTLVVNSKDIKNSYKKNPADCAAAIAGRREFKRETRVFLSRMYVKNKQKNCWVRYITPNNAAREIISFDRGSEFIPGEYKFKRPSPQQKLGINRGKSYSSGKNSPSKKRSYTMTANVREKAKY